MSELLKITGIENIDNKLIINNYPEDSNILYLIRNNQLEDCTSIVLSKQGDGSGTGLFLIEINSPLTITLDGYGRFYSDASGTLNESTTKTLTITTGFNYVYVKCTSGNSNMKFCSKNSIRGFGKALGLGSGNSAYSYQTTYAPSATTTPTINWNNFNFPRLENMALFYLSTFQSDITVLPKTLLNFYGGSNSNFTGSIGDIPPNCLIFSLATNSVYGNLNQLSSSIQQLGISSTCTVTGDIADIPVNVIRIELANNNTCYGDVSDFKPTMQSASFFGLNTIHGNIMDFDPCLYRAFFGGYSSLTGDVSTLKEGLTELNISGTDCSIYGDVADLPTTLRYFVNSGTYSTLHGSIDDFTSTLTTVNIYAHNTIDGSLDNLKSTMINFIIAGYNTIGGNIKGIPNLCTLFTLSGYNIAFGDIRDLKKSTMTSFSIDGYNTISGTLDASTFEKSIRYFSIAGYNTIDGDIAYAPYNLESLDLRGYNTINTYTPGRTWNSNLSYFNFIPITPGGLDASGVDNLIHDLATNCTYFGTINIKGTNASRTSNSDIDVSILQLTGYSVLTN